MMRNAKNMHKEPFEMRDTLTTSHGRGSKTHLVRFEVIYKDIFESLEDISDIIIMCKINMLTDIQVECSYVTKSASRFVVLIKKALLTKYFEDINPASINHEHYPTCLALQSTDQQTTRTLLTMS